LKTGWWEKCGRKGYITEKQLMRTARNRCILRVPMELRNKRKNRPVDKKYFWKLIQVLKAADLCNK
jgi:hypothetical protein